MTENMNYCENCGTRLLPDADFCEACGKRVQNPALVQPYQAPSQKKPPPPVKARIDPPYPEPAFASKTFPTAAQPKRKSLLWPILGGGCCLSMLCIAVAAVGLFLFANNPEIQEEITRILTPESVQVSDPTMTPAPEQPAPIVETPLAAPTTAPTQEPAPTEAIEPTPEPADPEVIVTEEELPTGPEDTGQELGSTYFTDNFSSNQYDWAVIQDEVTDIKIEDGQYVIHLFQENYVSWAYLPPDFEPTNIGFDAVVVPGQDQGGYGVMCHYLDEDNYYFVSIDPVNKEYAIGYLIGGEYYELMENLWMPSYLLNDSPHAVNNIQVTCDPDMITLFINNELEAQTYTEPQDGGLVSIFAETWGEIEPGGFKVMFDNLIAFTPVQ